MMGWYRLYLRFRHRFSRYAFRLFLVLVIASFIIFLLVMVKGSAPPERIEPFGEVKYRRMHAPRRHEGQGALAVEVADSGSSRPRVVKNRTGASTPIRGVPPSAMRLYRKSRQSFYCVHSGEKLPISSVNDDFCDCADGSDEPGTSACANGLFHCDWSTPAEEAWPRRPRDVTLTSSRVNDGICDCCDGSDEWAGALLPVRLSQHEQTRLNMFQTPCLNRC